MATTLDRAAVLAYRGWVQGLHGDLTPPDLDVLTVGLQDTPAGSAALGLAHRAPDASVTDEDLVLALTVRGSPHLHRRADLPPLRAALRPPDNDTLRAYLGGFGDELIAGGGDGPALLAEVVAAMRESFPGGTVTKGELSSAVSQRSPKAVRPWCATCGTDHVADGMFRLATLFAGVELAPHDGRRLRFRLPYGEPEIAADTPAALTELVRQCVRLAGPLVLGDLSVWLDTRSVTAPPDWIRPVWTELRDELVEVSVDGTTRYAHVEAVDAMRDPPAPPAVLLLPARDAYLLGNRAFLAPDRALAKAVWRPIGSPGALVVDGELAGVWQARKNGRNLRVSLTAHRTLSAYRRKAAEAAADQVAAVRGVEPARLTVEWEE